MGISIVFTTIGCVPLLLLGTGNMKWFVLLCAPFIGVGLALMLNTGTSLISDVIGNDVKSSAFVYGIYSLLDKFANGFLLYWLVAAYSTNVVALPWIMATIPIVCTVGTTFITWIGLKLYSDKLAKISVGSSIKKKTTKTPADQEKLIK